MKEPPSGAVFLWSLIGTALISRVGFNLRAVAAFIPAALIAIVLVPAFDALSQFSWFLGAGLGALIHYALADRKRSHADVSDEAIAVDAAHH